MNRTTDIKWDGWLKHADIIKKIKYNIAKLWDAGGEPNIVVVPKQFRALAGSVILGCKVVTSHEYNDPERIYVFDTNKLDPKLELTATPNK